MLAWSARLAGSSVDLARVLGLDECFQIGEVGAPEAAVLFDPVVDGAQRLRVEVVDAVAAFAVLANEVGATEQAQVLRNRGPGDGKGVGDLSRGLAAKAKQVEHGAAGGIGEGLEGGLHCLAWGICNRSVTHNA